MKIIFFFTSVFVMCTWGISMAQFTGKQFVSGSARVNFNHTKPETGTTTNAYNYQFDVFLGKFKTETKASGWGFNSSLGGAKTIYSLYQNGSAQNIEKKGVTGLTFGVGRFWQYYKHFNAKIGVYAGPEINLAYQYGNTYSVNADNSFLIRSKSDRIALSAGVSAGLYYRFSEKWWVSASLAFSNPIAVDYTFLTTENASGTERYKSREITYRFSPAFSFPSVGMGLQYFF
ncbi:hypothetical protein [Dyadobacter sp. 32]|uniref:hypothetical protein n=1 Tax=Dyadobacter sp. 32 TaxID=538966 RepID=UPI0011EC4AD8